ncbi:MAG: DUF2914 domain-containing protein [Desulfosarcina sp.]
METVGIYLKKERESKNISLSEVSRLTKISEFYLDFIEKDAYEKLPQGPYIKGYISSYSRMIGGDVDEALKLYDSLHRKKNQTETVQPENGGDKGRKSSLGERFNAIISSSGDDGQPDDRHNPSDPTGDQRRKTFRPRLSKRLVTPLQAITTPLKDLKGTPENVRRRLMSWGKAIKALSSPILAVRFKREWAVSPYRSTAAWLNTAGSAIKNAGRSIKHKSGFLTGTLSIWRNAASALVANHRSDGRRVGLVVGMALLVSLVLILAGFGFYHLFIYDDRPTLVSEANMSAPEKSEAPIAENTGAGDGPALSSPPDRQTQPSPRPLAKAKASGTAPHTRAAAPLSQPVGKTETTAPTPALATARGSTDQASAGQKESPSPAATTGSDSRSPGAARADANLNVLKASVCSNVKNRMPTGVDTIFPSSVGRIYVWNQIEAKRFPSKIRHVYYFNDNRIDSITLDVRSHNWRTWSAKSIPSHRSQGQWRVDITSAEGEVLQRLYFEIK